MISIFLSINNNEEVIEIPVIPEEIRLNSAFSNDSFDSMTQQLNLIGIRELIPFEIQSFFPIRDYPFLRSRNMWGMEYVETIERWRDRRVPLRLIITNDEPNGFSLNMPVTIDNFEYGTGKSGDIDYNLSLKEFVFVRVSG
jgi:hypothetical protein